MRIATSQKAAAVLNNLLEDCTANYGHFGPQTQSIDVDLSEMLDRTVLKVAESAIGLGLHLPECVAVGIISAGKVNSHVITVDAESSDFLVIVDIHGLMAIQAFAQFIGARLVEDASEYDEAAEHRLSQLLHALVYRVHVSRSDKGAVNHIRMGPLPTPQALPEKLTETVQGVSDIIQASMTNFLISHELAHLSGLCTGKLDSADLSDEESFHEEIECDLKGCAIGQKTMVDTFGESHSRALAKIGLSGSLYFLSCLNLLEKSSYVLETGEKAADILVRVNKTSPLVNRLGTHPTALIRRLQVWNRFLFSSGNRDAAAVNMINHDKIADLFDQSWPQIEEYLLRHHNPT